MIETTNNPQDDNDKIITDDVTGTLGKLYILILQLTIINGGTGPQALRRLPDHLQPHPTVAEDSHPPLRPSPGMTPGQHYDITLLIHYSISIPPFFPVFLLN
jgi:hypothetical protein